MSAPPVLSSNDETMATTNGARHSGRQTLGNAAAAWGVLGVAALLMNAVMRLGPVAVEAFVAHRLTAPQWLLAVGFSAFMAYSEGYRGFQRGFSPRVVARALHLARNPRPLHAILAPLFCMGLVHASRRRLVTSWALLASIVGLVLAMRAVPQPYRGIVDAGVVLGLAWGVVALVGYAWAALAGCPPRVPTELPEADAG